MKNFLVVVLFLVTTSSTVTSAPTDPTRSANDDPDLNRDTEALIKSRGFICETHHVTTADNYILKVLRIIHPSLSPEEKKRPVILQHGLLSSSADWLINSAGGHLKDDPDEKEWGAATFQGKPVGRNIGFDLAKRGYDVWLTNSRGNFYSRNHSLLDVRDPLKSFWDFSFDQMIEYDQPAVIDYVLNQTNRKDVGYIGHSQGTLIMFGLLSTRPEYNEKVKPFIALAPVVNLGNTGTSIKYLAKVPYIDRIARGLLDGEFLTRSRTLQWLARTLCASRVRAICSNIMFLANGWSVRQINMTRLPVYLSHFPAGTSTKNIIHYSEALKSGVIRKFDYGQNKNFDVYGWFEPPEYELEKITNNHIALFHSQNDLLATPADVDRSSETSSSADHGLSSTRGRLEPFRLFDSERYRSLCHDENS